MPYPVVIWSSGPESYPESHPVYPELYPEQLAHSLINTKKGFSIIENRAMTPDFKVGDRVQYDGITHAITVIDDIFRTVTLRPVDELKPIGDRFGPAVVIQLSKLPLY